MEHIKKLEALLFISGEPLGGKEIMRLLGITREAFEEVLGKFAESCAERGIRVIEHKDTYALATAPEASEIVEKFAKERIEGELSRAALETLSIILWKGSVSRSSIDYIRGVNSTFSLRTLLFRGLIERVQSEGDARVYLYSPTIDLLTHLGVTSVRELPQYEDLQQDLKDHD